ncbi:MAG: hypothetical protein C0502_07090 [Opitutus sp.]|nr:hypothetical protein [Opitutus sp.]
MSSAANPPPAPTFRHWLRVELVRELKLGALFLAAGLGVVFAASRLSERFDAAWTRLNRQLTYVALEQHPVALLDTFATRLAHTEYGWGLFSWTEPCNVTAARGRLRADFPEFLGLDRHGAPIAVRSPLRKRAPDHDARAAQFLERHRQLEARRFARLYPTENPLDLPDPTNRLARIVTKALGLPDAALHVVRTLVGGGVAGILLFSGVLALAAVALWQSRRPARRVLKLLLVPFLASALVWVAIGLMSVSAALFGAFTVNTSALAVLGGAPLLYLAAKAPLRLAEDLLFKPKPWDGVERRKNRGPAPGPGGTAPPVGGA